MLVEEEKNYKIFSVCYYCLLLPPQIPPLSLSPTLLSSLSLSSLSIHSLCTISMNNKRNSRMLSFELDTQKARFHCVQATARCTYVLQQLYTTLLSMYKRKV